MNEKPKEQAAQGNTDQSQGKTGADTAAAATASQTAAASTSTDTKTDEKGKSSAAAQGKEETSLLGGEGDETSTETKQEEVKEGEKKEEGTKDQKAVPEKYEFKVPEGMAVDEQALELATPVFKKHGLSQEAAQEIVDLSVAVQREAAIKSEMALLTQRKAWREEVKKDANWKQDVASVKQLIAEVGDDSLKTLFAPTSWLGDHPGMIRMLAKLAKERADDRIVDGSRGGQQELTQAERIYGKSK